MQSGTVTTPVAGEYKAYLARVSLDSPPAVSFGYSPSSPVAGSPVTFTASASDDTSVSSIQWDLGSGSFTDGSGKSVTKTFSSAGSYTIRVKATDDDGLSTVSSQTVTVAPPPRFVLGKVRVSSSALTFSIKCQATAGVVCRGLAQLSSREKLLGSKILAVASRKQKRHSRRVIVGSKRFSVAAGRSKTIKVSLNKTGRRLLARFGRLPSTLKITLLNRQPPTVITRKETFKPKKKRKH